MLTLILVKEILDYNPETGLFTWKIPTAKCVSVGDLAGSLKAQSAGYVNINIFQRRYGAHRLAWFYMTGEWPKFEIDHINGCRSDNRFANLRDVTRQVNAQNLKKGRSNTGLLGVSYVMRRGKGSYRAGIKANNKSINLGNYSTAEAAHAVYLEAKRRLHQGNTL